MLTRTLAQITDAHLKARRTVTLDGLTGSLVGVIPVGDRVQLALIVGGARIWTDAYSADTTIEIHKET